MQIDSKTYVYIYLVYATGLTLEDMDKAQVGISSVYVERMKQDNRWRELLTVSFAYLFRWYEGNPCNMHLMDLAAKVKEGVQKAGMIGYRFNTIGVSDGISMGTDGMSYSLQSRDLIADSIETVCIAGLCDGGMTWYLNINFKVTRGQWYDANISLPGCDKNMPGCLMAMGRFNRPSLMVYGGTIQPGKGCGGDTLDIVSAFQAYGEYVSGAITEEKRYDIIRHACPGPGACGGSKWKTIVSSYQWHISHKSYLLHFPLLTVYTANTSKLIA